MSQSRSVEEEVGIILKGIQGQDKDLQKRATAALRRLAARVTWYEARDFRRVLLGSGEEPDAK